MTADEVRALPAAIEPEVAFKAIGIGRTVGYELLRTGEFPLPVLRLGRRYKIRTADVLELLGLDRQTTGGAA